MALFDEEKSPRDYDAIVIGTGISGGWAAKELCEKGLKTLVLERGRNVEHLKDYPTMNLDPWDLPNNDRPTQEDIQKHYPKQNRTGYTTRPSRAHFFVKDSEHPYDETEGTRFDWIRGYHVGGRSLVWGRQSYRWSDLDFEANIKDGIGVDWPIRYKDIEPWYAHVEKFIGVSGNKEGLPQLPDSVFMPPMDLNCAETHLRDKIVENFDDRILTIGRTAHITGDPLGNRGICQSRNRCMRGCPFGAYFSSNSSTLPAAEATGNMTLRPDSIVFEIMYDDDKKKATGVRVIDRLTKKTMEFTSRIVFCNASSIASTWILMNSKSDRFPNGLGNDSGELGHNIMDHHFKAGAAGSLEGMFEDKYYKGRRPNGFYIPRFRNVNDKTKMKDFIRGYGYQGSGSRENWQRGVAEMAFGADFKDSLFYPGPWQLGMNGFGEILPYHDNKMELDYDKPDAWGLPTIRFTTEIKENELAMRKDMQIQAAEMLEAAGFKDVSTYEDKYGLGLGIHEMGTARMGKDAKTSVLNEWNQIHGVPNVFVTDGACMTSSACVNPSLTYMALTARAANRAVEELKKQNI